MLSHLLRVVVVVVRDAVAVELLLGAVLFGRLRLGRLCVAVGLRMTVQNTQCEALEKCSTVVVTRVSC